MKKIISFILVIIFAAGIGFGLGQIPNSKEYVIGKGHVEAGEEAYWIVVNDNGNIYMELTTGMTYNNYEVGDIYYGLFERSPMAE